MHVAAWLPPCRTSPKKAAPPQRVLDGPAAPGRRHGPFGPTARGSSTSRGNAGKCDSLHKAAAAAAAAAAALTYVPAELHAGGPLTGRRRCSASSIDRERGESYREGKRARPAPPPPSGGLSRDGGLCEASFPANWIRFPCCRVGASCGPHPLRSFLARPSPRRDVARSPARPPATARYV